MVALPSWLKSNALQYGGYVAFFGTCFTLAAYLTFPYDRVKDVLVRRVQAQSTPGEPAPKLTIEDLGPHWLNGVSLTGVVFERPGDSPGDAPSRITVDELDVSVSPWSLLGSGIALSVDADIGEGDLSGDYETQEGGPTKLDLTLDEVDLERFGLGALLGIPIGGLASGTIDVELAVKSVETQGDVKLEIEGTRIGDGKAKVKIPGMAGGLTVDAMDAGKVELSIAIKDGVATIEKLDAKGKDLELSGSGSIRLSQPLPGSRTDVTLSAKIDKAYFEKSERGKGMSLAMEMNDAIKRATAADGTMRWRLTGPLASLKAAPASAASSSKARSRAKRGAKQDDDAPPEE
jgi:type II secretion system protein N